jgi:glycosyltransferase involved in cell wall biosynthesis
MSRPARLHLLAVPHTVTDDRFSHCAFTGKVKKFIPMMMAEGWDVLHYGTDQVNTGATEDVAVITTEEQAALLGRDPTADPTRFVGSDADASSPLYQQFNFSLRSELEQRVKPGDIICEPFGGAHEGALKNFPLLAADRDERAWFVETGIGYPQLFAPYRVFESEAWRHFHLGHPRRGGQGNNWEWVIPNYFEAHAWDLGDGQGDAQGPYVLYFGRINDQKGLLVVCELARRRPDLRFVICGQGDPTFYLQQSPNIEYVPPLHGRDRSALLGGAMCVLMPSNYTEPFGGVAVEAQLCGTPVLGPVYGAFTETIAHGFNGYRCRTLGDWLAALELVETWHDSDQRRGLGERLLIQAQAQRTYGLEAIGPQYTEVFDTILTLGGDGYFAHRSSLGPITKAVVPATLVFGQDGRDGLQRPTGTPVSEVEWKVAQQFEKSWWLKNPDRWAGEKTKQEFYAEKMRFPICEDPVLRDLGAQYDFGADARILDVGCGPFSLMLRSHLGTGVAVDPIDYGPELELAYLKRGLQRVIGPAEKLDYHDEPFDEGWCYNCLQHVMDPSVILKKLTDNCRRVRIYEWLNIPAHEGHPHELRVELFRTAFPDEFWREEVWEVGDTYTPLLYGQYLAAVFVRRT